MANFVYTHAAKLLLDGDLDFNAPNDIRVMLVMTNTTCDTEKDVDKLSDFTTMDIYDGANYVLKALANETTSEDEPNDRGEFTADNVTWTALGAGTRANQAAVIIKYVDGAGNDIPLAFIEASFTGNGGDVTIQWNAQGIIQAQC